MHLNQYANIVIKQFVSYWLATMSQQVKAIKKRVGRLVSINWFSRVGAKGIEPAT